MIEDVINISIGKIRSIYSQIELNKHVALKAFISRQ